MAQAIRGADFSQLFRAFAEKNKADRFVAQMNEQKRRLREAKSDRKRQMKLNFALMALGGVAGTYGTLGAAGGAYFGSALAQAVGPEGDPSALFNLGLAGMSSYDRGQQNEQEKADTLALLDAGRGTPEQQGVNFQEQGVMSVPGAEGTSAVPGNREATIRLGLQSNNPNTRRFFMQQVMSGMFREPNIQYLKQGDGTFIAVDKDKARAGDVIGEPTVDVKAAQARETREADATSLINYAKSGAPTPASERVSEMDFTAVRNLSPRARSEIRKQISSERAAAGKEAGEFDENSERGITRRQLAISRSGDNSDPFDTLSDVQLGGLNQSAFNKALEKEKRGFRIMTQEEVAAKIPNAPAGAVFQMGPRGQVRQVFKPAKKPKKVPHKLVDTSTLEVMGSYDSYQEAETARNEFPFPEKLQNVKADSFIRPAAKKGVSDAKQNRRNNNLFNLTSLLDENRKLPPEELFNKFAKTPVKGLSLADVSPTTIATVRRRVEKETTKEFLRRTRKDNTGDLDGVLSRMENDGYNLDSIGGREQTEYLKRGVTGADKSIRVRFLSNIGKIYGSKGSRQAKINAINSQVNKWEQYLSPAEINSANSMIAKLEKPVKEKKFTRGDTFFIPNIRTAAEKEANKELDVQFDVTNVDSAVNKAIAKYMKSNPDADIGKVTAAFRKQAFDSLSTVKKMEKIRELQEFERDVTRRGMLDREFEKVRDSKANMERTRQAAFNRDPNTGGVFALIANSASADEAVIRVSNERPDLSPAAIRSVAEGIIADKVNLVLEQQRREAAEQSQEPSVPPLSPDIDKTTLLQIR